MFFILSQLIGWFNSLALFHQAHHFVLERLTHISGVFVNYSEAPKQDNTHIYYAKLLEHVVTSALHNSDAAAYVPRCLPQTRTAVRQEIIHWISCGEDDGQPKKMLWLTGPAGAGKTAVAITIADKCKDDGILAANFFFSAFSANSYQHSRAKLIPTIAYQLLNHHEEIRRKVLAAIERDPVVFDKRLAEQLESLILSPLREAISEGLLDTTNLPQILLVDAIDECSADQEPEMSQKEFRGRTEAVHEEVLQTLFSLVVDSPVPFRIILASRPEPTISRFISARTQSIIKMFLDNKYSPDHDIYIFLSSKFGEIRERFGIPEDWPEPAAIQRLVQHASGQFIYAATIVRFIQDPDGNSPQTQLKSILNWYPGHTSDSEPFQALDILYTRILRSINRPTLAVTWILAIDRLRREASQCPPVFFKYFLESENGDSRVALGGLNSLVNVVGNVQGENDLPLFHFYHQSFVDFLVDPGRSRQLNVDQAEVDRFLRVRWKETLKNQGPQTRPKLSKGESNHFLSWYFSLPRDYRQSHDCTSSDIDWWRSRNPCTIVLVMGETGCGKSHFINVATGDYLRPESSSLVPLEDGEIGEVVLGYPDTFDQLILLDTPGFDNYHRHITDLSILERITDRLQQVQRQGVGAQFGGIIYLHDITMDRFSSRYLLGPAGLLRLNLAGHVLIVTTKWGREASGNVSLCEARENALQKICGESKQKRGGRTVRFINTKGSAREVLATLLELQPLDVDLVLKEFQDKVVPAYSKQVPEDLDRQRWKDLVRPLAFWKR